MKNFIRFLESISEHIGQLTKWFVLYMVVITLGIVISRYFFSFGAIAIQESVMYAHAMVFMLGAAFTLRHNEHVRVDIFYQKMSLRSKAWVDLLGSLFLLFPVCIFILWSGWGYVASSWELSESSREAGGLPWVYLLKTNIVMMALLLIIQGVVEIAKSASVISGSHTAAEKNKNIVEG